MTLGSMQTAPLKSEGERTALNHASPAVVLGTSNSILRGGWVEGLRESECVDVKNQSAGASASAFVIWQMLESGFPHSVSDDAYYLLDTIVNDETFNQAKRYDAAWWMYYQEHILNALPSSRTVLVGFSSQKHFREGSDMSGFQEEMYAERGVKTVSLRRILLSGLEACRTRNVEVDEGSIFEDPGHFHRHLARIFGRWLGERLEGLYEQADSDVTSLSEAGFELLVPNAPHGGVFERRSTSLRTQDTIRFGLGESFFLPGKRVVHGICVDASRTRCIIDIEPHNHRRSGMSLSLAYNADSPRMQIKFVHFHRPLIIGPDGCTVTVRGEPKYALEHGIHSRPQQGAMTCLQLLSFLSGPVVPAPVNPCMAEKGKRDRNALTRFELDCLKETEILDTLLSPPDIPSYPRSFIEL